MGGMFSDLYERYSGGRAIYGWWSWSPERKRGRPPKDAPASEDLVQIQAMVLPSVKDEICAAVSRLGLTQESDVIRNRLGLGLLIEGVSDLEPEVRDFFRFTTDYAELERAWRMVALYGVRTWRTTQELVEKLSPPDVPPALPPDDDPNAPTSLLGFAYNVVPFDQDPAA